MQIENYNMPFLDALSRYDDGGDLADYDFNRDGFESPHDEENKKKLANRHRVIANKYMQVFLTDNYQALCYTSSMSLLITNIELEVPNIAFQSQFYGH